MTSHNLQVIVWLLELRNSRHSLKIRARMCCAVACILVVLLQHFKLLLKKLNLVEYGLFLMQLVLLTQFGHRCNQGVQVQIFSRTFCLAELKLDLIPDVAIVSLKLFDLINHCVDHGGHQHLERVFLPKRK